MNGVNTQLKVFPDQTIELWTRHKIDEHGRESSSGTPQKVKNYVLPKALRDEVISLTPSGVFAIYNVELMHAKTQMVKNVLYFFDVLVWKSQHLIGMTYGERHKLLQNVLGDRPMPIHDAKLSDALYLAGNMAPAKWDSAWQSVKDSPYCEGLVLKRTGSISALQVGLSQVNNGGFMVRIRKPMKNALY